MHERGPKLRVLVVDDSSLVRQVAKKVLEAEGDIEVVGMAQNGQEALHKVLLLEPDVVVTDLLMPERTGLDFIRAQMQKRPLPIVVMSVISANNRMTLAALEAGAVDFVHKPTTWGEDTLNTWGKILRERVREAAQAHITQLHRLIQTVEDISEVKQESLPSPETTSLSSAVTPRVVAEAYAIAVAASTGGPQALRYLLSRLPGDLPPVLIVQHIPQGYSQALAERLNAISRLQVVEAAEGMALEPGKAYVGKAGWHLTVVRPQPAMAAICHLTRQPPHQHYPAADVLFSSVAKVFGERALAVVLTGMGRDGQQGAAWLKACGATVIAESEMSAVVYGMPRAVVQAGLADRVLPLDEIPQAIVEWWQREAEKA